LDLQAAARSTCGEHPCGHSPHLIIKLAGRFQQIDQHPE
jgi:hypothetical protein